MTFEKFLELADETLGNQQRLLVPRRLAAAAATDGPGGVAAVALLLARALARAAVVAAVGDIGVGVELGQAVEAGLQGVGVVLLGRVGEGLEPLLAVLQLLLGFADIKLRALGVAALPGAQVQALLGAQAP